MVAMSGKLRSPEVIHRGRIELIDGSAPRTKQPYHTARELGLTQAEKFIADCQARAEQLAAQALEQQIALLGEKGQRVEKCAVLLASGRALPPLDKILGSHPMLHTAEGELFRNALRHGGERCGLQVMAIRERELFERAAAALGIAQPELRTQLGEMGRRLGPPWREDEKLAALAAWIALSGKQFTAEG